MGVSIENTRTRGHVIDLFFFLLFFFSGGVVGCLGRNSCESITLFFFSSDSDMGDGCGHLEGGVLCSLHNPPGGDCEVQVVGGGYADCYVAGMLDGGRAGLGSVGAQK
jgi:hypothetical protein